MRFVLAMTALVLSGIMLVLGIGQTTFLAGPNRVVYTAPLDTVSGLAVLNAELFNGVQGQANVVVQGVDPVIAVGQSRDVEAWVAPFGHAQVEADSVSSNLQLRSVRQDAEAAEAYAAAFGVDEVDAADDEKLELQVPSPVGSDLWLDERVVLAAEEPEVEEPEAEAEAEAEATSDVEAEQNESIASVRLPVNLESDESVLAYVATASGQAVLSVEWVQDRRTPWAGPLLLGGAILAIVGLLLYLWAVDHDRRGLGPRRGRKGPFVGLQNVFSGARRRTGRTKRVMIVPAMLLGTSLVLTGCSPSYWPDLSPEQEVELASEPSEAPATAIAPVPVTQGQIDRILDEIVAISDAADSSLDPAGLGERFVGDALVEREANYTIRREVSDYDVIVPRLTSEALGYQLVQSTETWPRTIFTVVASQSDEVSAEESNDESVEAQPQDSPSIAVIMTQANPHANYLVFRTIALRGGITMPEAAPVEEGTARLANDIQSLVMMPLEVGPSYAAVLAGGADVAEAEFFDLEGDSLLERSGAAWVAQSTEAAAAAGQGIQYSVSVAQTDSRIVSLSTGVDGALVATTVQETRVEEPEEDGRWRPTVPKSLAALSGLEGQQDKLISVVAHQLLFFVPGATDGGKIQLLGYTSDLIEARNS